MYGTKILAEPFIYAKPLNCLDIYLTNHGLSLYIFFFSVGEPEIEVKNSNPLISDLLNTIYLEASLNPSILEPGWLESLASS